MRVAFITNYEVTIYFHAIAERLRAAGHEVAWIAPSAHWATWLRGHGVADADVLDLAAAAAAWTGREATDDDRHELATLEAAAGWFVGDLIQMDRVVRTWPHARALRYLAASRRQLDAFLGARGITTVFGEQTFAIELLTSMVARARGVALYQPHVLRIPDGRLGFFPGPLMATVQRLRPTTDDDRAEAAAFLATYRRDRPRPYYFVRYDHAPRPRRDWPAKLRKHLRLAREDPHDVTHFAPGWIVQQRSREVLSALAHRVASPYEPVPPAPARPFVLYPLHRQPEASIDVLGGRTSDQLELLRAVTRTLPATHDLYVKEHPNGLGDRTPAMLRALRDLPGVRLIEPGASTFTLSDAADLTLTVSGTVAYEAALRGRPAATTTPMYFGPLLRANGFNPYVDSIADLLRPAPPPGDARVIEFLADMLASSFVGGCGNPIHETEIMAPANLDQVARGYRALLEPAGGAA